MAGRKRGASGGAGGASSSSGGGAAAPWPEEPGEREQGLYSLHRMFDIVGAQLTHRDVRVLSFLFVDVLDEAERGRIRSGRDFLLALERQGRCDESNLRQLLQLLRIITRHDLLPYVSLKRRRPGECLSRYIAIYGGTVVIYKGMSGYWGHIITCHDLLPYVSLKRRCPGESLSRYIAIYGVTIAIYEAISGYRGHIITRHDLLPYVSLKRRRPGECLSRYITIYGGISGYWGHIITRHDLLPYVSLKRRRPSESLSRYIAIYGVTVTIYKGMSGYWGHIITHHDLLPYVSLKCWRPVCPDLVDKYLEETSIRYVTPRAPGGAPPGLGHPHKSVPKPPNAAVPPADIRLRVRAEYCQHDSALHGNVFSNKQDPLERQFERFNQANTILKSRDLGSIICDIKFSELTYLDAFWRDYINGSLLEALKGVFITDSLKQAVGHEAIKLLVNVDEEDYELGRQKLLRNLMLHTAP
ncbi:hypothetical protein TURU_122295 [Turdus rufiventris]|nr:hypothetical protein TURU_122295 [Turdus rufiventris]